MSEAPTVEPGPGAGGPAAAPAKAAPAPLPPAAPPAEAAPRPPPPGPRRFLAGLAKALGGALLLGASGMVLSMHFWGVVAQRNEVGAARAQLVDELRQVGAPSAQLAAVTELAARNRIDRETMRALAAVIRTHRTYLDRVARIEVLEAAPQAAGDEREALRNELRLDEEQGIPDHLDHLLVEVVDAGGSLPAARVARWAGPLELPELAPLGPVLDPDAVIDFTRRQLQASDPRVVYLAALQLAEGAACILALIYWIWAWTEVAPQVRLAWQLVLLACFFNVTGMLLGLGEGTVLPYTLAFETPVRLVFEPLEMLVFGAVGLHLLATSEHKDAAGSPGPGAWRWGLTAGVGAWLWSVALLSAVRWDLGPVFHGPLLVRRALGLPEPSVLLSVLVMVAAAIREELIFRAFLMGAVLHLYEGRGRALMATLLPALAWMTFHLGSMDPDWLKFAQILPIGFFFGALMLRRGIWSAVLAHSAFNLMVVLGTAWGIFPSPASGMIH